VKTLLLYYINKPLYWVFGCEKTQPGNVLIKTKWSHCKC